MKDFLNIIELNSKNLLQNFDFFQELAQFVFPVVKANAYGHGIEQVAKILEDRDFPYLVFDKYYEYHNYKDTITQNVLIMGWIEARDLINLDFQKVAIVVQSMETIATLGALNFKIKIHLEINTGMNRWGIKPIELLEYLELIESFPNLELEGVMSHLANSDAVNLKYTTIQTLIFDECVQSIFDSGFNPKYIHLGQTAGSIKNTSQFVNSIRPGIGLYGINHLEKSDRSYKKLKNTKPTLTLKTKIIKIIKLKKGESVGYNCTFIAQEDCNIAVLPIGYFEGTNRGLGNLGSVKIKNKFYKFAGKICMNICMINLGSSEYPEGTVVEMISKKHNDQNSINNIAKITNTFHYGLLTSLNHNLVRKIVQ